MEGKTVSMRDVTRRCEFRNMVTASNISGVEAKLPPGWTRGSDNGGNHWFLHDSLQISTWHDPRTSRSAGPVPSGWASGRNQRHDLDDESQKLFFVNLSTGETTFRDLGTPISADVAEFGGFMII